MEIKCAEGSYFKGVVTYTLPFQTSAAVVESLRDIVVPTHYTRLHTYWNSKMFQTSSPLAEEPNPRFSNPDGIPSVFTLQYTNICRYIVAFSARYVDVTPVAS